MSEVIVVNKIKLELIDESPFQVRTDYGDIDGLANDIEARGLLQPILVRPIDRRYEIVHGHRRFRAVKLLGEVDILAMVRELDDESAMVIHGSENIHRKDLTDIEEGRMYNNYMTMFDKSPQETADVYEVSPDTVRMKVNLLDLPKDIQEKVHKGDISYTKARKLTILTREPIGDDDRRFRKDEKQDEFKGQEPAPRTDRWFPEIREIAENKNLHTESEIAKTAQLVREGTPVKRAIQQVTREPMLRNLMTAQKPPQQTKATELQDKHLEEIEDVFYKIRGWGLPLWIALGDNRDEAYRYFKAIHDWTEWLLKLKEDAKAEKPTYIDTEFKVLE